MKIRGHGSAIAISLAALAVVIAGTGAAVAVAATTVNIVDPTTPAYAARVDSSGRLKVLTTGPATTIHSSGLLMNPAGDNFVTSPTTAVLNVTQVYLSETRYNTGAANTDVRVYVYKTGVNSAGSCADTGSDLLGIYQIGAGDNLVVPFDAPLTVKPTGNAKYCLDLYSVTLGGTYGASYYPAYQLNASVVSGNYSGTGVSSATATKPPQTLGTDLQPQ